MRTAKPSSDAAASGNPRSSVNGYLSQVTYHARVGMGTIEVCPVILAGGAGTRLWPLSREDYPKQLLRLRGDNTLLQDTLTRLDGLDQAEPANRAGLAIQAPLLVCNEEHRFLVADQLQAIGKRAARILLEPVSRNTAPALTIAALVALEAGTDPVLLAMPADHVVTDKAGLQAALVRGFELAHQGSVVTFGVVPDRPETGYGYVEGGQPLADGFEELVLAAFHEKPDRDSARRYVESGRFFWNSGLFAMRASVWLKAIEGCRPEIADACRRAFEGGGADGDFYRVEASSFTACPSDSIDYAVMERLAELEARRDGSLPPSAVVPLDAGWSDIGSWPALLALNGIGEDGNLLRGDVYEYGSERSVLLSEHRFLAAVGVEDLIVVETPDAVLVADKAHSQDVREVVAWLKAAGREEAKSHRRVFRPWGYYEQLDAGDRFQVKRLSVKPGAALSLQMHYHRAEHWVVVRGTARVTRGEEEFTLTENESTYIPVGTKHRLANPGTMALEVIEVQTGSYLGEDDIVRFEDRYNRDTGA